MILAYVPDGSRLTAMTMAAGTPIPAAAVWIDLLSPDRDEYRAVETLIRGALPSREDMSEIEPSSRLYSENGAHYMIAGLLCGADSDVFTVEAITFILAGPRLITLRYAEPGAFSSVAAHLTRACPPRSGGDFVLIQLLEAIVDRSADVLEQVGVDVELISRRIFDRTAAPAGGSNTRYHDVLSRIGSKEGLVSAARESLASLQRLLSFLGAVLDGNAVSEDSRASIKSMSRDVAGLSDYAAFISNKLQFLLDATIGMLGLEQNNIIKIFAVLSVVLMPPTLIASIYGMNFNHIPELRWEYGYPATLVGMVVSGILPYVFFKWRGWL